MQDLRGFCIPLKVPFRAARIREGVLVKGPEGWGEYSPFPGFAGGSARPAAESARSAAFEPWPDPVRDEVEVHATVPAVGPTEALRLVKDSGCASAKVKVAEGDDEARLEAVREALGPAGRVTIDANGRWSVEEAVRNISILSRYGVQLAEQPVKTVEEMARLRRLVSIPLAADELVTGPGAARTLAERRAADVLVVKTQSMGGVRAAMRAVEAAGLPAIVSSSLETSIGLAAGLALAAALPELEYPCGLNTIGLLEGDVVAEPLFAADGRIRLRRPAPDEAALAKWECEPPAGSAELLLGAGVEQGR